MSLQTDKLPTALPAIRDIKVECPSFGHESHVVCGKCHIDKLKEDFGTPYPREEIESLRSRARLLRSTVWYLVGGLAILFVIDIVLLGVILGKFSR